MTDIYTNPAYFYCSGRRAWMRKTQCILFQERGDICANGCTQAEGIAIELTGSKKVKPRPLTRKERMGAINFRNYGE
jgi:hypothetical protein